MTTADEYLSCCPICSAKDKVIMPLTYVGIGIVKCSKHGRMTVEYIKRYVSLIGDEK